MLAKWIMCAITLNYNKITTIRELCHARRFVTHPSHIYWYIYNYIDTQTAFAYADTENKMLKSSHYVLWHCSGIRTPCFLTEGNASRVCQRCWKIVVNYSNVPIICKMACFYRWCKVHFWHALYSKTWMMEEWSRKARKTQFSLLLLYRKHDSK